MINLGVGEFIDKFERYFGKIPTYLLLLVIGLAVLVFCIDVIYTHAIGPAYDLIYVVMQSQSFDQNFYSNLVRFVSAIIAFVFIVFMVFTNYKVTAYFRKINAHSALIHDCLEACLKKLFSIADSTKSKRLKDDINKFVSEIHQKLTQHTNLR